MYFCPSPCTNSLFILPAFKALLQTIFIIFIQVPPYPSFASLLVSSARSPSSNCNSSSSTDLMSSLYSSHSEKRQTRLSQWKAERITAVVTTFRGEGKVHCRNKSNPHAQLCTEISAFLLLNLPTTPYFRIKERSSWADKITWQGDSIGIWQSQNSHFLRSWP